MNHSEELARVDRLIAFYSARDGAHKANVMEALYQERARLTKPTLWQRVKQLFKGAS